MLIIPAVVFRLQFESQRTRLKTQLEYVKEQLHKRRGDISKIKDSIKKEEDAIVMLKEVRSLYYSFLNVRLTFMCLRFISLLQVEEKLLAAVDESQLQLQDFKNKQVEQMSYVNKAKAELDRTISGLHENSRYLWFLIVSKAVGFSIDSLLSLSLSHLLSHFVSIVNSRI